MRKKFLSMSLAMGLIASLFVGVIGASADDHYTLSFSSAHFPFVPNGAMLDGTGPWYGSITVQNLEDDHTIRVFAATDISLSQGDDLSDSDWNTTLQPNASKTFSADDIVSDDGSAVSLIAVTEADWQEAQEDAIYTVNGELNGEICDPDDWDADLEEAECEISNEDSSDFAPNFTALLKQATPEMVSSNAGTSSAHLSVDGHTAIPGADIAWGPNSEFCYEVFGGVDACNRVADYDNGISDDAFDGSSYLPIVQTNSGWNTVIAVSNVDASIQNAGVNITLIPTEGSTFGSGQMQETFTVNPGDTEFLNLADFLSDQGIDEDWVGSAWIESDIGVASSAIRLKAEDNMSVINTAAPSQLATFYSGERPGTVGDGSKFEIYGPLVYKEYNGWNTGVSLVNLFEATNSVTVTFYGPTGNVMQSEHLTLPPRGSNFIYSPSLQDSNLNDGFVGSVVISADAQVHAGIDQVKYETGEAMSYLAGNGGTGDFAPDAIGMPLVQKGNVNGMGDVSGIQLFNADSLHVAQADLSFYLSGGSLAAPTQNAPINVTMQPMSTMTIYAPNYSQMASNFIGSAQVETTNESGNIVGVSNNVNYAVQGDGSTAFNMVNSYGQYRLGYGDGFEPPLPPQLD